MKQFSQEIQDFGYTFSILQSRRYDADYDPYETFYRSEVLRDIKHTEDAINNLSPSSTFSSSPNDVQRPRTSQY